VKLLDGPFRRIVEGYRVIIDYQYRVIDTKNVYYLSWLFPVVT